jgi:hypothetical protein
MHGLHLVTHFVNGVAGPGDDPTLIKERARAIAKQAQ